MPDFGMLPGSGAQSTKTLSGGAEYVCSGRYNDATDGLQRRVVWVYEHGVIRTPVRHVFVSRSGENDGKCAILDPHFWIEMNH